MHQKSMRVLAAALSATAILAQARPCLATGVLGTASASSVRRFEDRDHRKTYIHVPGEFTQQQAWATARAYGGYPVVFGSMSEHSRVVAFFGYRNIAPCHTGHYQLPTGREPGVDWRTYTNGSSAPLNQLFNSDGPDDGARNKWGWRVEGGGAQIFYGPSNGKNEDAGVIWHDNGGKLEDVSVNHRGGVLVEINR